MSKPHPKENQNETIFRADNVLTAGCFIEALGVSLTALTICAQGRSGRRDRQDTSGDVTQAGMATTRLLAQAVTAIEVRPETDVVTVVVAGDGQLFPRPIFG